MPKFMEELTKALTAANEPDLQPYDLEAKISEELLNLQPLAQMLKVIQAEGLTHEYRLRTSHPQGWFEGETSVANNKNGAYTRRTVALKIQRIWGEVTGFAQAVNKKFIDTLATELEGSVQGMADLLEYGVLYGTANDIGFTGDAYQYSGILPRLYAYAPGNVIDAGGDKVTLDDLDAAIVKAASFRQVRNDPAIWMMGQRMKQVVDGLQSKVQIPLRSMELADGKIVMASYANRPIFETDYVAPDGSGASPTVTATAAAGGSLSDATWHYALSSITMTGEQVVGTSDDAATATTNNSVDLTWTHDDAAVLYMVWRKEGSGAWMLLDIIPALTYDANGNITGNVETYSDEGTRTPVAVKPLQAGEQMIVLANLNPDRGAALLGLVDGMGEKVQNLLSYIELGRRKDSYEYMLKSYHTVRCKFPNLFSCIRHVKLS
jgi:hypothetical protein